VHSARVALGKAHQVLEERPEVFCEFPKKSSFLLAKLEKVAPESNFWYIEYEEESRDKSERALLAKCGGMAEVARNAKCAKELVKEAQMSFEKESASFQERVQDLSKNDRKIRLKRNLAILGGLASLGVLVVSSVAIYSGLEKTPDFWSYRTAVFGTIIGIGGIASSFMSLDKTIRSSNKSVEQAIGVMKKTFEELKQSLDEIVCSVPFRV
jgi:hypothetical protein